MVFNNSILLGAAGQGGAPTFDPTLISNSVWLDGSADGLTAPSSTFSAQDGKEFTLGTWFQLNQTDVSEGLFCAGANPYTSLRHDDDNKIYFQTEAGSAILKTQAVFRDFGWYHVLVSVDTTQSTASNRVKLFVNGIEQTLDGTQPSVNHAYEFNTAVVHEVGDSFENGAFKGYLAQSFMIGSKSIQQGDFGIADFLDTFTFGTNGSQFIPKKHSEIKTLVDAGSSNSFLLQYENSSALGTDSSTNTNTFTATSMSSANQSTHTPSKTYAVFNPLANADQALPATFTLSEGNQKIAINNSNTSVKMTLPFVMSGSNIIRAQFTFDSVGQIGVGITGSSHTAGTYHTSATSVAGRGEVALFTNAGVLGLVVDGNFNNPAFGGSDGLSNGDIVDVFVNCDVGAVYFAVNGTIKGGASQADIQNGVTTNAAQAGGSFVRRTAGEVFNFYAIQVNPSGGTITANTGQSAFTHSYSSITSLTSLNTADLPAPDFQGKDYFDATLYEGNGLGQRVGDFIPFTDVGTISQSVAFNAADEDELRLASSVSTSPTNVQKKTVSCWLKPLEARENWIIVGNGGSDNSERIYGDSTGRIQYLTRDGANSNAHVQTSGAFLNDPSQWVHVVVALDYTDGSTEADRVKIYVNGVRQTDLAATTYPANNMTAQAYINKASTEQIIGCHPDFHAASDHSNMYYAEYFMVDGHQLDASVFGQLDTSTNRWVPKASSTVTTAIGALSGGFGNCGFYLDFSNTSDYGEDDSGNNRDFTEGGVLDATNQSKDAPSKNYAVYDTVKGAVNTAMSMSEGNLTTKSGNGSVALAQGFPIQDGYWYYEVNFVEDANNMVFGLYNPATTVTASDTNPSLTGIRDTGIVSLIQDNGGSNSMGLSTSDTGLSNPSAGDVVGIYIRKDKNNYGMWFSLNGTAMNNTPAANATATADINFSASIELVPAAHYSNAGTKEAQTNFGQLLQFDGGSTSFDSGSDGNWKHAPVTGFKALNQDNLDDTASKLTAWSWIKNRDRAYPNAEDYVLVDRVRGIFKVIPSNETDAETTEPNTVQRFFQRGVQVGSETNVNRSGDGHVLWQWLLGDSATTGSTTSPAGSIASTSIVADAGHFAVISYTGNATGGATIGHGMSGAPEMIWIKERDNANGFIVGSTIVGFDKILRLDTTDDEASDSGAFNSTAPSATLITLGSNNGTNRSSGKMICYAFRSVPGVCKIGSYIGNGSTDGPYINIAFKPRWVIYRVIDSGTNAYSWTVVDTARSPINGPNSMVLHPNLDSADSSGSGNVIDVLSDGFKRRDSHASVNQSGKKYIYMAMADIGGNGTLPPIYGR